MLLLYGGWGIFAALAGPGRYDDQLAAAGRTGAQMAETLQSVDALHRMISVAVYGSVIVGGLIMTGGAALYYLTRRAIIDAHVERTPAWVVQTLRAVG